MVVYLALIVLIRMMAMPISLLDYSLNKGFIATELCENRSKPEMHCAGTCFLNKQLTKANENSESKDQKSTGKTIVIDFFEPVNETSFLCMETSATYRAPSGVRTFAVL